MKHWRDHGVLAVGDQATGLREGRCEHALDLHAQLDAPGLLGFEAGDDAARNAARA